MEKESSGGKTHKHLTVVKPKEGMIRDWTVPYNNCEDAGRGAFEYDGEICPVVVRYYSCQRMRFEKQRHFAEVIISEKEKFIIDGIEKIPLVQHMTDIAWIILECRKKLRQANTKPSLKLIK